MEWYNEPSHWQADGATVTITSGPQTDFWRMTHNGQINDNGHFYFQPVSGDFVAEVKVSGNFADQYDQAGLMIRVDAKTWLKCGLEILDGVQRIGAVVTRDFSDWSLQVLETAPSAFWLRIVRHSATFEVYFSLNGADFSMIRQAYLSDSETVSVGLMTASPIGDGFTSTYEGFSVTPHTAA
jgi:regulation of enolase protein 1 (concanavalin A-like superfamily)